MSKVLFSKINEGIIEERYRAFNINLKKNLDLIHKFGGLKNIIGYFKDKDIIIVGAGSTLTYDLEILKESQRREGLLIISTDMALLPLFCRNILPEFVISCETTPVDYFSQIDTRGMHLLAFSCMSNSNLRKWKGHISFYNWMIHNDMYDTLWKKAGVELGFVATCSIVTSQAVSFALGCGINSLMLIGNDMGFMSEYYTKGTVAHKKNLCTAGRLNPIETIEYNKSRSIREFEIYRGDRLYFTNSQFLAAKNWLEELFKNIRIPIFESSELGLSPQYVQKITLKNYLKRFD